MNHEHSQQDPQNFFNEEWVSDRLHPVLIPGAEHVAIVESYSLMVKGFWNPFKSISAPIK